ncbi:hypothetical protein N7512_010423 [Penicillium capsulatum]|nr:hypothetical protein N7512_010423 [Penicillium capsulatum]
MGAGQSTEYSGASPEELSHLLAERFATKCFTPLELTHFKENFFSRASEQGGLRYWNEKTLSDTLGIPDGSYSTSHENPLDAGPVLFRMVSYLGAFPFQNTMAPSVLTFEAMVKVVVLLTERYGKVLRRGRKDRVKLLFGSLADVGRKDVAVASDPNIEASGESSAVEDAQTQASSHAPGFSIDEPVNDEYDEDEDDDLALAALESLDAIEVFKHDHRVDRTVYETRISIDTFRRLLMLLIVIAPLKPLEPVNIYTTDLSVDRIKACQIQADSIIAAFSPEESDGGISYRAFARTVSSSLPYLFDPLTALFEHLLFSKNLDLSQRRQRGVIAEKPTEKTEESTLPASIMLPGSFESTILTPSLLSHISFFLPSASPSLNLLRSEIRLHPVFSTASHGSSLTSFSHNVLTWQSASILVLQGAQRDSGDEITLGVYIPQPWRSSTSSHSTTPHSTFAPSPCLFQLFPKHKILSGNPSPSIIKNPNLPTAWFSTSTGIALGCHIPPSSRTHQTYPRPHGGGSLILDASLESAEFHTAPVGHDGIFLPSGTASPGDPTTKTKIDLYSLEIWGVVPDPDHCAGSAAGGDAVETQQSKWAFEAREAERRRNINLKAGGGESATESARWLLETAGVIGDQGNRSGGSV